MNQADYDKQKKVLDEVATELRNNIDELQRDDPTNTNLVNLVQQLQEVLGNKKELYQALVADEQEVTEEAERVDLDTSGGAQLMAVDLEGARLDKFAAAALQGLCANPIIAGWSLDTVADQAVKLAKLARAGLEKGE
jgi:hypothetical protein